MKFLCWRIYLRLLKTWLRVNAMPRDGPEGDDSNSVAYSLAGYESYFV